MRQNEVGTPVTLTLNNVSAHDLRKNRPATGTDQYLGDRYFDPYTGFRVVAGAPLTLQGELTPGVCDGITVPVNTAATGLPTISGTAQVGEALTANTSGIADADGLSGATFSYQWVSNGWNSDADIQGAMGSTYSPATDDEGKTLKVQVSFTDDAGHDESLTSAPTDTVTGPPPVPMPGNTPATGLPSSGASRRSAGRCGRTLPALPTPTASAIPRSLISGFPTTAIPTPSSRARRT